MTPNISVISDLTYAVVDGHRLQADLYVPDTGQAPPVVVYVHGGGWAAGSRTDHRTTRLCTIASAGIAVLSIDYRLIDRAHFPAQVHDVKAAVRWIKAHAGKFGVNAERVGVWGASAGAVLAALVGLTGGLPDWEGSVGERTHDDSQVHAVVFWFGISDFTSTATRSTLEAQLLPDGPEAAFLGLGSRAEIATQLDLAQRASPLTWVHRAAPQFLIAHGDRDRMVPFTESSALHAALTQAGATSVLLTLGGAGHEDEAFDTASNLAVTAGFLGAAMRRDTAAATSSSTTWAALSDSETHLP